MSTAVERLIAAALKSDDSTLRALAREAKRGRGRPKAKLPDASDPDLMFEVFCALHDRRSCPEDSRVDYWYPRIKSIIPSADTFDEKVALGFALHRGAWYLRRVEMYGAEVFDPKTTSWALNF